MFLNQLHRNPANALEKIIEGFVYGLNDFFLGTIMGDGDSHLFYSDGRFTRRNSPASAVVEVPLSNLTLIFSSSRLSYLAVLSACKSSSKTVPTCSERCFAVSPTFGFSPPAQGIGCSFPRARQF